MWYWAEIKVIGSHNWPGWKEKVEIACRGGKTPQCTGLRRETRGRWRGRMGRWRRWLMLEPTVILSGNAKFKAEFQPKMYSEQGCEKQSWDSLKKWGQRAKKLPALTQESWSQLFLPLLRALLLRVWWCLRKSVIMKLSLATCSWGLSGPRDHSPCVHFSEQYALSQGVLPLGPLSPAFRERPQRDLPCPKELPSKIVSPPASSETQPDPRENHPPRASPACIYLYWFGKKHQHSGTLETWKKLDGVGKKYDLDSDNNNQSF